MGRKLHTYESLNLHNKRYGRLTIIGDEGRGSNINDRIMVRAICDCGKIKIYRYRQLKYGMSKSCGCYKLEVSSLNNTKHGLSSHDLYCVWSGIIQRCTNSNSNGYSDYGGRGVLVCEEWRNSFECFFDWAIANGWRKGLQIDKDTIGEGKLYSPQTCVIITRK